MAGPEIDRIGPTQRSYARAAMPSGTQRWRELLFLHWSFPIETVRRAVPPTLELDTWEGRAWVGVVPFVMEGIRTAWMPARLGLDFLETNVRTYVVHDGVPGVYFFSLEASSFLAVQAARIGWGLPYFHARMARERSGNRFSYKTTRRSAPEASLDAEWVIGEPLGASPPGSFEHFLLERYVLFSFARSGALLRGLVHHVAYPAQRVSVSRLDQGLVGAAGLELARERPPEVAHYAEGVDVEVFGPWPVTAGG